MHTEMVASGVARGGFLDDGNTTYDGGSMCTPKFHGSETVYTPFIFSIIQYSCLHGTVPWAISKGSFALKQDMKWPCNFFENFF